MNKEYKDFIDENPDFTFDPTLLDSMLFTEHEELEPELLMSVKLEKVNKKEFKLDDKVYYKLDTGTKAQYYITKDLKEIFNSSTGKPNKIYKYPDGK